MGFLEDHLLAVIVLLPLLGAALGLSFPREDGAGLRGLGVGIALLDLALALWAWTRVDPTSGGLQLVEVTPWIPSLGIDLRFGVDGISLALVLLATFLAPLVLAFGYGPGGAPAIAPRGQVVALLALEAAVLGSLMATDLMLFYVFYEAMLVPAFFLVGIWGEARAPAAAMRFVVATMALSLPLLVAILYSAASVADMGGLTFDWATVAGRLATRPAGAAELPLCLAFVLAFAVKAPLFPLHAWLPAYAVAPSGAAAWLSGVLSKVGAFGLLRYALYLFPHSAAMLMPALAALAVAGTLYGAMLALVARDLRLVFAYASLSHLGLILLGVAGMTPLGLTGSVTQMVGHGLSMGTLFLLAGALAARQEGGTLELETLGGLARPMPRLAAALVLAAMASVGLPGLCNFVGELLILLGTGAAAGPRMLATQGDLTAIGRVALMICGLTAVALVAREAFWPGSALARSGRAARAGAVAITTALAVLAVAPAAGPFAGGLLWRAADGGDGAAPFAQPFWLLALLALGGTVVGAAYTLRALQGALFGPTVPGASSGADLTTAERLVLAPLLAAVVGLGVYPAPLLRLIGSTANQYAAHYAAAAGPLAAVDVAPPARLR